MSNSETPGNTNSGCFSNAAYRIGLLLFIGGFTYILCKNGEQIFFPIFEWIENTFGIVCLFWLPLMLLAIPLGILIGISGKEN